VLRRRSRIEAAANKADQFNRDVEDAAVLFEFAAEDESSLGELKTLLERLATEVEETETEMRLSGPNDARDAIVTINAGAGGTDAQDLKSWTSSRAKRPE
jgi:peptide chain release factor 2